MAKVKCLLSLWGWWMGKLRAMLAPLPSTRGMLAAKFASVWVKQWAQLQYERMKVQPAHDSGDDEDHGEPPPKQ